MSKEQSWPQAGRERMIVPQPVGTYGTDLPDLRAEMLAKVDDCPCADDGRQPCPATYAGQTHAAGLFQPAHE